jgi:hypothetical protein
MSRDLNLYWLRSDLHKSKLAEHLYDPRPLEPELVALVSTREGALVARLPKPGSPDPAVAWRALDDADLEELIDVFESLAAEEDLGGLVESNDAGRYLMRWELTGSLSGAPFRYPIQFIGPGERWNRLGRRLREALAALNRLLI